MLCECGSLVSMDVSETEADVNVFFIKQNCMGYRNFTRLRKRFQAYTLKAQNTLTKSKEIHEAQELVPTPTSHNNCIFKNCQDTSLLLYSYRSPVAIDTNIYLKKKFSFFYLLCLNDII